VVFKWKVTRDRPATVVVRHSGHRLPNLVKATTKDTKSTKMEFDELSNRVIGCAIEVHRHLGPGLLESAYEQCLAHELSCNEIAFQLQLALPVQYKEVRLDCGYRIDILIENRLIVELKSVAEIKGIHEAQLLTYMKLAGVKIGLLMNFNVTKLRDGIKRFVL
jgi:GxxExxY protein